VKKFFSLLPVAGALILAGCATPYTCELGMECLDTFDAYEAAKAGAGNKESTITDEERMRAENTPLGKGDSRRNGRGSARNGGVAGEGVFAPYAGVKLQDKPVYAPAQPLRIWIAPWIDGDTEKGDTRLLSGQFMYVTIGGKWTMGEMNKAGTAGGAMFQPWAPTPKAEERVNPQQRFLK